MQTAAYGEGGIRKKEPTAIDFTSNGESIAAFRG